MSKSVKITMLIAALLIVGVIATICIVIFSNNNSDGDSTAQTTPSAPYITSLDTIEGGFKAIYSDGTTKEFLYPVDDEEPEEPTEPEEPEEKVYVTSLSHDDGSIVVTYSNGSTSFLPISESGGDSNVPSNPSVPSTGKYVTAIFDMGDGTLSVRYSDGKSDTIKKTDEDESEDIVYISKVEQTASGIKVTYSDGTSGSITSVGDLSVSVDEIYKSYKEYYSTDISLDAFLKKFLSVSADITDNAYLVAANRLRSAVKINTEFVESSGVAVYSGSGVIWKIADDFTYIVTNYHVVYSVNAVPVLNGGSSIARGIYISLYGNENEVVKNGAEYNYGSALKCTYVGGGISVDLAVIKVATSKIKAVNPDIQEIVCAESYHVGETAIAIGNPLGEGISVTKGVVSKESEVINLKIDSNVRQYRCMRIDTSIYQGSSGGGLYNLQGELIGITNGGDGETAQNINYAIPVSIVKGIVNGIITNETDGIMQTNGAYTFNIGTSLTGLNPKYVYDSASGFGKIKENVTVGTLDVLPNTLCNLCGLNEGDVILSIQIGTEKFNINQVHDVAEALYNVLVGKNISVTVKRGGTILTTPTHTIVFSDLKSVI